MSVIRKTSKTFGNISKDVRILGDMSGHLKAAQLVDGPQALWMLDEPAGTVLPQDSSGYSRHMTGGVAGGTLGATGILGGRTTGQLNGGEPLANHLGYIPSASWMAGTNGVYTVECLYYQYSYAGLMLVSRYGDYYASSSNASWLFASGTNGLFHYARYNSSNSSTANGGGGTALNTPKLATFTYDYSAGLIRSYVNGMETITQARASGVRAIGAINIAGDYLLATVSGWTALDGRIANVAVYNKTLTPAQILAHAQSVGLA